jgi:transposase
MDLTLYHAEIAAVEGRAGRDHTAPRLLISLWLYAYSRGISSARELSRQCEFEPGWLWLCGCQPIGYRTLSGFRSDYQVALDELFVQVLGMLSAEGLITMSESPWTAPRSRQTPAATPFGARRSWKLIWH